MDRYVLERHTDRIRKTGFLDFLRRIQSRHRKNQIRQISAAAPFGVRQVLVYIAFLHCGIDEDGRGDQPGGDQDQQLPDLDSMEEGKDECDQTQDDRDLRKSDHYGGIGSAVAAADTADAGNDIHNGKDDCVCGYDQYHRWKFCGFTDICNAQDNGNNKLSKRISRTP